MSEITNEVENKDLPHPTSVDMSFMIEGIKYTTMEEVIGILKNNSEQTENDWFEFFEIFLTEWEPQYQKFIPFYTKEELLAKIASVPATSVSQIFQNYQNNAEQLMRALAYFDPEEIFKSVGGKLLDEETLEKTQERTIVKKEFQKNDISKPLTDDMFETQNVTYSDTYRLYQIEGKKLGLDEDAYAVQCVCTTTGKNYYLFVEKEFATSAVDAIASTIRDAEGNRLKRADYLLLEAEA
jgi:hypothetical protein